jgi:putative chitinase
LAKLAFFFEKVKYLCKIFTNMDIKKIQSLMPEVIYSQLPSVIQKYSINTDKRLAHFLSQCGHESGGFRVFSENLNYSAEGLLKTFPKYFTKETAAAYARKPERIANRVYGNRMGNGDEASGDGWKYRGRGCIQLTGKSNYSLYNNAVPENVVASPDLVSGSLALDSAGWFWDKNKLNALSDTGTVEQITRRVNGGQHGLTDRKNRYNQIILMLSK